MGEQIVKSQLSGELDVLTLGNILARSGYFAETKDAAQAVVRVLAGAELGLQPIQSMVGIHIIQGRPVIGASTLAGLVRRSGRYDYVVKRLDEQVCELEFMAKGPSGWQPIGVSAFSIEDAKKAGSKNLDRFPRNMLFARAISNGVRWYCPDLFMGPVYTPDELPGAEHIDLETGEIIGPPVREAPVAAGELPPPAEGNEPSEKPAPAKHPRQPLQPERLKAMVAAKAKAHRKQYGPDLAPVAVRDDLIASVQALWPGAADVEDKAAKLIGYLLNTSDFRLIEMAEAQAIIDWLSSDRAAVVEEANAVLVSLGT